MRPPRRVSVWTPIVVSLLLAAVPVIAEDPAAFFQENCAACHTIGGGKRVGPDLKGVLDRADRAWLIRFINDPQGVVASGDPYALKLTEGAGGSMMIEAPGMTPELAGLLLDYIASQSGGAPAPATAPPPPPRPPAPEQAETGKRYFTGETPLARGGQACINCHDLAGLSAWGGGRLGPDLTQASSRLGGPQGLSSWLGRPPTPTMRVLFGPTALEPDEIAALVALLQYTDDTRAAASGASAGYLIAGIGGGSGLLLCFGVAWRRRLVTVRAALVAARRKEERHG